MTHTLNIQPPVYRDYVLDALLDWRRQGLKTALLTLINIDGAAPRPLGSQIAVAEDGRAIGAISGGCAEQALVLDALQAISRSKNYVELYGEGSRFKDLVLPCGSGIHVAFDVRLSDDALVALVAARQARHLSTYVYEDADHRFERLYRPQLRTVVLGSGNIVPILAQLAHLSEFDVIVYSPDETTRQRSAGWAQVQGLISPGDWTASQTDADTALISLFHDHAYEADILNAALKTPAFYIGALGSRRTHARRIDDLRAQGWSADAISRIKGPVGLNIGAKTPPEIALSILAEIVQTARNLRA